MKRMLDDVDDLQSKRWMTCGRLLTVLTLCIAIAACGGTEDNGTVDRPTDMPSLEATSVMERGAVTVVHPTATPTPPPPKPRPDAAIASLSLSPAAPRPGDRLTVQLELADVDALYGVEVHLSFEPSSVNVVDAYPEKPGLQSDHGGFLSPDFVVQNVVSETKGEIHYAIAQMLPRDPVSGGGVLMATYLEAASAGEFSVGIDRLTLVNDSAQEIPVTYATREIRSSIK